MRKHILLSFSLLFSACTPIPGELPDGGLPPGDTSGGFTISAAKPVYNPWLSEIPPAAGRQYLSLTVSLHNTSAPPLLASSVMFSLGTMSGVRVLPSKVNAMLDGACVDLSVAKGGALDCALAFEVPTHETPATLFYDDHTGHSASAPVGAATTLRACDRVDSWSKLGKHDDGCDTCLSERYCRDSQYYCNSDEQKCIAQFIYIHDVCDIADNCSASRACVQAVQNDTQCSLYCDRYCQ